MEPNEETILESPPSGSSKQTHIYTLTPYPGKDQIIRIVKFDLEWELVSAYKMTPAGRLYKCDCPASMSNCRHKFILSYAKSMNILDRDDLGVVFDGKSKLCQLIRLPNWMQGDLEYGTTNNSGMVDLNDV